MPKTPFCVELAPGQTLRVTFAESDGAFEIRWGKRSISVHEVDGLPDDQGRTKELYRSRLGIPKDKPKKADPA